MRLILIHKQSGEKHLEEIKKAYEKKNHVSEFKIIAALKDQTISKFISLYWKGQEGKVKASETH